MIRSMIPGDPPDKHVVTPEFRGIRRGDLVRFIGECIGVGRGDMGLVVDRIVLPRESPDGLGSDYDPVLMVTCRGMLLQVHVLSVEKVEETDT